MIILENINDIDKSSRGRCISIGNFDGIHQGHMQLIKNTIEIARKKNLISTILTFDPMPEEFFDSKDFFRLMEMSDKYQIFDELGIDQVIPILFNKDFSEVNKDDFVRDILINKLMLEHLIVGNDFQFGYQRQGNISLLKSYANQGLYCLTVLDLVKTSNSKVSSRDIRALIKDGRIKDANTLMAMPFSLSGKVIHGEKRGRELGYPTANIEICNSYRINGIFLVSILFEHKKLFGLASWGDKPTFSGKDHVLEINIFDFESDIYGKDLKIIFLDKIRDQIKFNNKEELIDQMDQDKMIAEILLRKIK